LCRMQGGDLTARYYADQVRILRRFARHIGPSCLISRIRTVELQNYRNKLLRIYNSPSGVNLNDYLISIVVGSNFTIRCRLDIAASVPIVLDDVPVFYETPKDQLSMDKCAEEVRNVVSERVFSFDKKPEKQDENQTRYMPTSYCGYCGNWHADGECPLADSENWPNIDDDDFMF